MNELPALTPDSIFYSVDSVRRIDRAAIEVAGIAGYMLMTRAAAAALDAALERYPGARRWLILCGGGNNAGDGYVLARLAKEKGIDVSVVSLVAKEKLSGDAATAARDLKAAGLDAVPFRDAVWPACDLVVDALLGSGLERDVGGDFRLAVEAANRHPAPVLALDVPTGLHGDSGQVMGAAIVADATVTFVGLKSGLVLADGPEYCGTVIFHDLDIPHSCRADIRAEFRCLPADALAGAFPPRPREAHKGLFGHVLIAGGGPGMPGAVRIAGEAALRSGAGLVSIATHPSHAAEVNVGRPELMVHAVHSAADVEDLLKKVSVVAVGPGLGTDDWAKGLLDRVVDAGKAIVADADALNLIAGTSLTIADAVLTPHPGEAARLLATSTADVQAHRLDALAALAARTGATVVLKGAGTLVSSADGLPWLCSAGNPGMASAGMGDALTGIIASLRAQGFSAEAAAVYGVELHAQAGDSASADGERGMLATDLIENLRRWVNS